MKYNQLFSRALTLILLANVSCSSGAPSAWEEPDKKPGDKNDETILTPDEAPDAVAKEYPLNMGNNPVDIHRYASDPTIRVYDDVLYVYPSADHPNPESLDKDYAFNGFTLYEYRVLSSPNGMDWKDHGQILDQKSVLWSDQSMYTLWACDCIKNETDGKYYFYFPTLANKENGGGFRIGYAVADNPGGPYAVYPKPIEGPNNIDPNVFLDDDGTYYLYWGGGDKGALHGAELNPNMTELMPNTDTVLDIVAGDQTLMAYTNYKEGTWMFKRNNIYYLTYALENNNRRSELHYSTGDNPLGPFTYQGKILDPVETWTTHHSIVKYKGDWILFYHSNGISGEDKKRSFCADYLTFDGDKINVVERTLRGIGTIYANREIQIDKFSTSSAAQSVVVARENDDFPANWMLKGLRNGWWSTYDRVDFGDDKSEYSIVKLRYMSAKEGGSVEIVNDKDSSVIATVELPATSTKWSVAEAKLQNIPSGVVNLRFNYKHTDSSASYNVDWVKFQ